MNINSRKRKHEPVAAEETAEVKTEGTDAKDDTKEAIVEALEAPAVEDKKLNSSLNLNHMNYSPNVVDQLNLKARDKIHNKSQKVKKFNPKLTRSRK